MLRLVGFCERSFGGAIPEARLAPQDAGLVEEICQLVHRAHGDLQQLPTIHLGVDALIEATDRLNDYVTRRAPWSLVRSPDGTLEAASVLYAALDGLRLVLEGLFPVMPRISERALCQLGQVFPGEGGAFTFAAGRPNRRESLRSVGPLFPRLP